MVAYGFAPGKDILLPAGDSKRQSSLFVLAAARDTGGHTLKSLAGLCEVHRLEIATSQEPDQAADATISGASAGEGTICDVTIMYPGPGSRLLVSGTYFLVFGVAEEGEPTWISMHYNGTEVSLCSLRAYIFISALHFDVFFMDLCILGKYVH